MCTCTNMYVYIYIHRMIHDYTRLSYESPSPDIQRARFNTDHPIATLDDHLRAEFQMESQAWNTWEGGFNAR